MSDEEYEETSVVVHYTAGVRIDEQPEVPIDIAVLWIRDPEQVSGWREYYIKRKVPPPKPGSMGFKQQKKT